DRVGNFFGVSSASSPTSGGEVNLALGRAARRCGMSLLPPTSSFAERVEALFAVVRGRGLALGALDRRVLAGGAEGGVPLELVARGMLRAAERVRWMGSGGGAPRTLGACRPEVEEEIAAWKQRHLGAPLPLPVEVFDTAEAGGEVLAVLQGTAAPAQLSGHAISPGGPFPGAVLLKSEREGATSSTPRGSPRRPRQAPSSQSRAVEESY